MCCLYLTNYVQIREVVRDFQHQVLQAHEQPYNEDTCAQIPQVSQGFQYFITSSCDVYNVHCKQLNFNDHASRNQYCWISVFLGWLRISQRLQRWLWSWSVQDLWGPFRPKWHQVIYACDNVVDSRQNVSSPGAQTPLPWWGLHMWWRQALECVTWISGSWKLWSCERYDFIIRVSIATSSFCRPALYSNVVVTGGNTLLQVPYSTNHFSSIWHIYLFLLQTIFTFFLAGFQWPAQPRSRDQDSVHHEIQTDCSQRASGTQIWIMDRWDKLKTKDPFDTWFLFFIWGPNSCKRGTSKIVHKCANKRPSQQRNCVLFLHLSQES